MISPIETAVRLALKRRRVFFREQYPIGPYRADFYLPAHRLVIEADGAAWHSSPRQRSRDARRDVFMRARGLRIARLTGREICRDADAAVARVLRRLLLPRSNRSGYADAGPRARRLQEGEDV